MIGLLKGYNQVIISYQVRCQLSVVNTHTNTDTHTRAHTHTHTHTWQTHARVCTCVMHTHTTNTHTHTHIHIIHKRTHMHTQAHAHTHICMAIRACARTYVETRARARVCGRARTCEMFFLENNYSTHNVLFRILCFWAWLLSRAPLNFLKKTKVFYKSFLHIVYLHCSNSRLISLSSGVKKFDRYDEDTESWAYIIEFLLMSHAQYLMLSANSGIVSDKLAISCHFD